jgi:GT2 family glycosyltransferase
MDTLHYLLTLSIVVAVAYLAIVAAVSIVAALRAGGRREEVIEDHEALSGSRFTIPVTIIVPVSNDTAAVSTAISSLLALNYPELEVVVVSDGTSQPALDSLVHDWQLAAREFFYRRTLETADVRRIYRSGRDSRLMIIDKAAGGYSDALNCGVNVARYRYVMSVSPEVVFDRDALLRMMSAAFRDPANVIGASSHVERGEVNESERAEGAPRSTEPGDASGIAGRASALFQRLASARSLMDSRLAWRYLRAGLGPNGAVVVWRRDAVIKLKGFSATAADADLDMMFRLQTAGAEGADRFDRGVDVFGRVGPQPVRGVLRMSARRQTAAWQILAACLRGGARSLAPRTLAYFIQSEFLVPMAQAWIMVTTVAGASAGWVSWSTAALAFLALSFANAAVSAAALLLRGAAPGAPEEGELRALLWAGPLEFLIYRPLLVGARMAGTMSFVTGGVFRRTS